MTPLDHALSEPEPEATRADRRAMMAFVTDAETEAVLRQSLADLVPEGIEFRRAGIQTATATLAGIPTPLTILVDLAGEQNPLGRLADLAQVVEPDVRVLVVGDRQDLNFYRQVTRELGALEYLYKPLVRDTVARLFGPYLNRAAAKQSAVHGGRLVTVTGVRGGVGASTVAANLSWYLGAEAKRHTVLLDTDLQRGICALLLGVKSGSGLQTALEAPSRIDELFIERAAQPAADRLHVLAAEEQLTGQLAYAPGAARQLVDSLRRRYNFVVADLPFTGQPLHQDLLNLAQQRVLVMTPTLASIRDTLRMLSLPNGPAQSRQAVVVLNRAGAPGSLDTRQVADALKMQPDIVIADGKRSVERAASLGLPAYQTKGAFRAGITTLAREVGFGGRDLRETLARRRLLWWRR